MTLFTEEALTLRVLSFSEPSDVLNFGLTCKRNLNFIQDKTLWAEFAQKKFNYNRLKFIRRKRRPISLYRELKNKSTARKCQYISRKSFRECGKTCRLGKIYCSSCLQRKNKWIWGVNIDKDIYITLDRGIVYQIQNGKYFIKGIRERNLDVKDVSISNANEAFLAHVRELTSIEKQEIGQFNSVVV